MVRLSHSIKLFFTLLAVTEYINALPTSYYHQTRPELSKRLERSVVKREDYSLDQTSLLRRMPPRNTQCTSGCNRKFTSKDRDFRIHIEQHERGELTWCSCGGAYAHTKLGNGIDKHLKDNTDRQNHHVVPSRDRAQSSGSAVPSRTIKKRILKPCTICSRKLPTDGRLNIHLREHANKQLTWCTCGEAYGRARGHFNNHQKEHASDLANHQPTVNGDDDPNAVAANSSQRQRRPSTPVRPVLNSRPPATRILPPEKDRSNTNRDDNPNAVPANSSQQQWRPSTPVRPVLNSQPPPSLDTRILPPIRQQLPPPPQVRPEMARFAPQPPPAPGALRLPSFDQTLSNARV